MIFKPLKKKKKFGLNQTSTPSQSPTVNKYIALSCENSCTITREIIFFIMKKKIFSTARKKILILALKNSNNMHVVYQKKIIAQNIFFSRCVEIPPNKTSVELRKYCNGYQKHFPKYFLHALFFNLCVI